MCVCVCYVAILQESFLTSVTYTDLAANDFWQVWYIQIYKPSVIPLWSLGYYFFLKKIRQLLINHWWHKTCSRNTLLTCRHFICTHVFPALNHPWTCLACVADLTKFPATTPNKHNSVVDSPWICLDRYII